MVQSVSGASSVGEIAPSPNHISVTHPELVKRYGSMLWMDPGEPAVRDQTVAVVLDVVQRYDIDGVHIDDYFYPYKEKDRGEEPSSSRTRTAGGSIADPAAGFRGMIGAGQMSTA